jgi:hypothetical protein
MENTAVNVAERYLAKAERNTKYYEERSITESKFEDRQDAYKHMATWLTVVCEMRMLLVDLKRLDYEANPPY